MKYQSKVVTPDELTTEEIESWNSIIEDDSCYSSPFFSYEFTIAAHDSGKKVYVCIFHLNGNVVGFFPFQYKNTIKKTFKIAERVGGDLNDYYGLIVKPGFTITPAELLHYCQVNFLIFSHLHQCQKTFGLNNKDSDISPIVDFTVDDTELNSSKRRKKKHFQKETERRLKRIETDLGKIQFEFQNKNIDIELKRCIDFKRQQYQRTLSLDPLHNSEERDLLYKLANTRSKNCNGIISTLYAGEQWLATHFGLINNNVMHYWFPVYHPDFQDYSAGRILIYQMIMTAQEKGLRVFDFGAGDSQMKRKFCNSEISVSKGIWRNNSITSFFYQSSLSLRWKLNSMMKSKD